MKLHHHIDGSRPLSGGVVKSLDAFIDKIEDAPVNTIPVLDVIGVPEPGGTVMPGIAIVNKWERVLRRLERLSRPTVAVAHGDYGGIAVEALLATDLRLAATGTRLHLPTGPHGVWPGMGLYRLANQVGFARVRRSILFGSTISVGEALARNIIDEVAHDVPAATEAAVALLETAVGQDVAVCRQLMLDATTTTFEEALGRHLAACDRLLRRDEAEEVADAAAIR